MALRERIHSLETEYAITFVADDDNGPGAGSIVDVLMETVQASHGISDSDYLLNGSKLAHDVGHAEWSLPECHNARELAVFDKAADYLFIDSVVPRAQHTFLREGYTGRLIVAKNNADHFGHTYGCHENFQMLRNADLMGDSDFVRYISQNLIPFLVTRQILAGSGRLISEQARSRQRVRYEISQRAGFIETVVSRDTTRARPIFNLGREGESFSSSDFRRLHLILGDANVSGWATWIKMGTTGLMLRLIEDLFFDQVPALADPVAALHTIAREPSNTASVALRGGGSMTALDIQWDYYDLADKYLDVFGASQADEALMEEWGRALEDFESDPLLLRDRVDWVIKKHLIDAYLRQNNLTLDRLPDDRDLITDLQAFDLRYHELSDQGLYTRAFRPDTLLSAEEIAFGQENPPPYTRARMRGETVRLGRECGLDVAADRWTEVTVEGERISMMDPLEFDHIALARWDRPWTICEPRAEAEPDEAAHHYKLGMAYRRRGMWQPALVALRTAVDINGDSMRFAQGMAETLLLAGVYDEAVEWYDKFNRLVGTDEEDAEGYTRDYTAPGDACRLLGEFGRAFHYYKRALRVNTVNSLLTPRSLGLLHLKRGEFDSARTNFQRAIEQTVERLVSLVGLGALHLVQGAREQSVACFEQAAALPAVRAKMGLTPSAQAYFQAVALVGLEREDGLPALEAALENQAPEAAEGTFALPALADLLVRGGIAQAEALQALVDGLQPLAAPPDEAPVPAPAAARRVDWLRRALAHEQATVRAHALGYLGWRAEQDNQDVLEPLLPVAVQLALGDPEDEVRRAAVQMLSKPHVPREQAMGTLVRSLRDPSPAVRWAAEISLEHVSQHGEPVVEMTARVGGGQDAAADV